MKRKEYQENLWDINYFTRFKNILKEKFGLTIPEWHSISFGSLLALIGGMELATVVIGYLLTNKGLKGHLKDVKNEIIYFVASFVLLETLQNLHILQGII